MDAEQARQNLIAALRKDCLAHEQGRFDDLGPLDQSLEEFFASADANGLREIRMAFNFWDSWLDERDHGFPNFYEGVTRDSWPSLARSIVAELEGGQPLTDPLVLPHFDWKPTKKWKERISLLFKRGATNG